MFGKAITALYTWYYNREVKKHQKKKLTDVEKKKVEFYENMQQLYGFVTWLNDKGFTNRRARKTFWRNVMEGQSVLEDIINDLIQKYAPEKKKDEDGLDFKTEVARREKEAKDGTEITVYPPQVPNREDGL